jgi:DNA mismatch repair protein MutL
VTEGAARRPIRRLSRSTIERIAAGEVVERPASVVKELVENAVDAGATSVTVRIGNGGLASIEVADDGLGIPEEELAIAVERHATSKLDEGEELDRIATLGFRGEALAAIGAISRLRLLSRVPGTEEARGIEVVGGEVAGEFVEGRAPGTTVTVRDLFFNTPARRKFLRSPATERREIVATLERQYLARPSVGLVLVSDGEELLRWPGTPDLREAASRVFGPEFAERAVAVRVAEGPRRTLEGWIAPPPFSRSTASALHLSVNGRAILSRALGQAVRAGYADRLPRTRYPVGALHLALDPSQVDVNVHPTKREVRFAGELELGELLHRAVRAALLGEGPAREAPFAVPMAAEMPFAAVAPPSPPVPVELPSRPSPRSRSVPLMPPAPPRPVAVPAGRSPLRLLGPVGDLYWVAESSGEIVLVDPHAASERLLYDELRARGRLGRQELLEPARIRLSGREREELRERREFLERAGFEFELVSHEELWVRAVPSYRGHRVPADELPKVLDELSEGGRPSVPDGLTERAAAIVACHAAIRAGDAVSADELGRVLEALLALPDAPSTCAHGRPIAIRLPRSRLDRWFLRSGG